MAIRYVVVRGTARNPEPMLMDRSKGKMKNAAKFLRSHFPNARIRVRNVEGFEDKSGKFHPIRSSEGYSHRIVGERKPKPKRRTRRR